MRTFIMFTIAQILRHYEVASLDLPEVFVFGVFILVVWQDIREITRKRGLTHVSITCLI